MLFASMAYISSAKGKKKQKKQNRKHNMSQPADALAMPPIEVVIGLFRYSEIWLT